ncbi:hypothetical protein [Rhodococcus qingshengii]|uniref:hypothetical protein n=1 Tax=Rhodococcus qingshengii TaxID=334542 RepID=UPI002B0033DE|nr:hypothetical protein [Rhodococcus qingshengii]MEA1798558.1 hypothetical protein [Rhodococcus qingshengii]
MLGARLTAATAGIMQVTVGLLYIGPEEWVRRPLLPGQVSAVVYIEGIGPVWTVSFVLAGLYLIWAAAHKKGFVPGHIAATGIWGLYGGAILISALLTEPPVPVLAGTIACFVALMNLSIARGCAERGLR